MQINVSPISRYLQFSHTIGTFFCLKHHNNPIEQDSAIMNEYSGEDESIELFIGYVSMGDTDVEFMQAIYSCGATGGLISVQKRPRWNYGFAVYSNLTMANQAMQIV